MTRYSKALMAAVVFALVTPALAQAQASRTWVSGVGDDANPCSRTAPCKTFSTAQTRTATGGEVSVLDPGGFGGITITKALTLNGDGTLAGILSSLTNGIIVSAPAADVVVIRNISINGAGNGTNGIRYITGRHVIVENCNISGYTGSGSGSSGNGITADLTSSGALTVINTNIIGGANTTNGIRAATTTGTLHVSIDNVNVHNTNKGVSALQIGTKTVVKNSTFAHNTFGVFAESSGTIDLLNSTVSGNGTAVNAALGGLARISGNTIFENTTGFTCSGGGAIETGQNNITAANGAGGCVLGTTQVVVQ